MRSRIIYCLAGMAIIGSALLYSCACADDRPIVVLREDDCRATWRTPFAGLGGVSALDYGKQKHIPVTWAVISDRATTGYYGYSLVWSDLLDYLSVAGGEAASHSCTHTALTSDAAYIDEIVRSKATIEANLPGYTCTTFLQPGTWTNNAYLDKYSKLYNPVGLAIQSTYERSQAYLGAGWIVGPINQKYGLTNITNIDYNPSNPSIPATMATLDIVADTPGLVFVVACHGVQESNGTGEGLVRADMMKAFMDKLAELRDSGKVRLMSMHDAYNAGESFSSNLNHVPNPGFELYDLGQPNPMQPWKLSGTAQVMPSGGIDNSKYASMQIGTAQVRCEVLGLWSGRYEISWYQKPEVGFPTNKSLQMWVESAGRGTGSYPPVYLASYTTANPSIWERKTALMQILDRLPWVYLYFRPQSGAGYGVDNVSIVSAPLDPAVSPTGTIATITPTQLKLEWLTPPVVDGTVICIRYSSNTCPLTPSNGYSFGEVPAISGATQNATMNVNWSSQQRMYCSIFSVAPGGSYSPPDVVGISTDTTAPTTPSVSVTVMPGRSIAATWCSTDSDPRSGIYGYNYAVGSNPGLIDVVPWTFTTQTGETITIPVGAPTNLYLSVKAENPFGYWSSVGSVSFLLPEKIADALLVPDGSTVTIDGIVTAVFSGCLYVEDTNRLHGVKVTGACGYHEGDEITVTGVLSTSNGERVITVGEQ